MEFEDHNKHLKFVIQIIKHRFKCAICVINTVPPAKAFEDNLLCHHGFVFSQDQQVDDDDNDDANDNNIYN